MKLSGIMKIQGNKGSGKRRGRGYGSGRGGHTVGFGTKGQKARGKGKVPQGFEGGQTPLYKRLPRWGGFRNPTAKDIKGVSLFKFNAFKDGQDVVPEDLVKAGILRKLPRHGVKVLNKGLLKKKVVFKGFLFSKSAEEEVKKVGGKIEWTH